MVQASQTRTLSHGGRVVEICIKDDIVAHGFTVVRRALSNTNKRNNNEEANLPNHLQVLWQKLHILNFY